MLTRRSLMSILAAAGAVALLISLGSSALRNRTHESLPSFLPSAEPARVFPSPSPSLAPTAVAITSDRTFVGPRENVPADAPRAYGFWSLAIPREGVLSRSGQPLPTEFQWLRGKGWKSVVNLRRDGERGEIGDDRKLQGFAALDFAYLSLPITDGHPPTETQAEEFLRFVTNPANLPVHVHCRGGFGRTGTMIALYRYAVQGWTMDEAIQESRLFKGGVSALQERWLRAWATSRGPGSF